MFVLLVLLLLLLLLIILVLFSCVAAVLVLFVVCATCFCLCGSCCLCFFLLFVQLLVFLLLISAALSRRFRLPLSFRSCRCGRLIDTLGHHRAGCADAGVLGAWVCSAQACLEAGGRVSTNVMSPRPCPVSPAHRRDSVGLQSEAAQFSRRRGGKDRMHFELQGAGGRGGGQKRPRGCSPRG